MHSNVRSFLFTVSMHTISRQNNDFAAHSSILKVDMHTMHGVPTSKQEPCCVPAQLRALGRLGQ